MFHIRILRMSLEKTQLKRLVSVLRWQVAINNRISGFTQGVYIAGIYVLGVYSQVMYNLALFNLDSADHLF